VYRVLGFVFLTTCLTAPSVGLRADPIWTLDALRGAGVLPPKPTVFAHPMKDARVDYTVGDKRDLWTYDLSVMPPKNVSIASTCQGVGDTVVVFVADSEWDTKVIQADVDAIIHAFDVDTPNQSGAGIMATNTALFGAMSDVDGDPHLLVFIYAIPGYQGQAFDGFFRPEDLAPFKPGCESNPMDYCSNEAEIVHVNSHNAGSDYMIGVMAHEFQHLIHHAFDVNEESWINESMSELAMSANGYEDAGHLGAYLASHTKPLVTSEFVHYGAVMLFGTFLYERFGDGFIQALVKASQNGIQGLEAAWQANGIDVGFNDAFADWALANATSDYDLLDWPDVKPDGTLPALQGGQAIGDFTVQPYTYHWLAGPVAGAGAQQDLVVRFKAPSKATLRVAGFSGDELVLATPAVDGGWRVAANLDEVIVALGNPTGNAVTSAIDFALDSQDTPVPEEIAPDAGVPDVPATDATTADSTPPDTGSGEVAAPDATTADSTPPDTGSGEVAAPDDGSGCAMSLGPTTGSPALLLLALTFLAVRRRFGPVSCQGTFAGVPRQRTGACR